MDDSGTNRITSDRSKNDDRLKIGTKVRIKFQPIDWSLRDPIHLPITERENFYDEKMVETFDGMEGKLETDDGSEVPYGVRIPFAGMVFASVAYFFACDVEALDESTESEGLSGDDQGES